MIIRVLVEAEQVDVGEIAFDGLREVILVDEVKDETDIVLRRGVRTFEEGSEDIDGVGIDAGTLVLGGVADRVTYVTGEAVGLVDGSVGGQVGYRVFRRGGCSMGQLWLWTGRNRRGIQQCGSHRCRQLVGRYRVG